MPDPDRTDDTDSAPEQPAEPRNRAERRAQRRGRKPSLPPTGNGPVTGHHDRVVVPRRAGRRGNR
jgi:hypothetical protein